MSRIQRICNFDGQLQELFRLHRLGGYATYLGFSPEEIQAMVRDVAGQVRPREAPVDVRITPVTPHSRVRRIMVVVSLFVLLGGYFSYVAYVQFRQLVSTPPPQAPGSTPAASPDLSPSAPAAGASGVTGQIAPPSTPVCERSGCAFRHPIGRRRGGALPGPVVTASAPAASTPPRRRPGRRARASPGDRVWIRPGAHHSGAAADGGRGAGGRHGRRVGSVVGPRGRRRRDRVRRIS